MSRFSNGRIKKKTENILDANIQITYFNPSLAVLANSVDPDQLASEKKPTELDLHCLSLNKWSSIKNLDQVIWLAGN